MKTTKSPEASWNASGSIAWQITCHKLTTGAVEDGWRTSMKAMSLAPWERAHRELNNDYEAELDISQIPQPGRRKPSPSGRRPAPQDQVTHLER
jgi:hypothetical protein